MDSGDFRCSYSVASSALLLFGVALLPQANAGDCDLFSGRWVFDSSYPLYSSSKLSLHRERVQLREEWPA
ncbi:hypothetical protein SLEP1_g52407 [Rubroshorea leprosula]|uniref:Trichome birefringence-like N-terminal domain-containing protein n=1 Tax=Rubroshorea leprosula TaxID=152421 RepID=A0AAV5M782_9ROSI|nr:hypothetical protein SLEP1_g52407 [Rubroshorea leprosula]